MRILTLTNLYPNPYQPHRAAFNRQHLQALAELHPVQVIAPVAWTDELAARRRAGVQLPRDRRTVCDGIRVEHPRYLFPPRVLRRWYGQFFGWSVRPAFQRALKEFRPEIVYSLWAYPDGWAAVELGRRAGLPVVVKVHGSDIRALQHYPDRLAGTAEALRRADAVITVSRDLASRVIALGAAPTRTHTVYCGVDANQFRPGSREEARDRLGLDPGEALILFIGNLVPVKGLDVLVEACARLRQQGLRFTCSLIGQGPLKPQLERQVVERGLTGCVRLLGPRPHDKLPDWYRAASVFVLPSHSEGVPHVLLEALASGTPFVASRVGGIPEIAHHGINRLVPSGDVSRLAEALAATLQEPAGPAGEPVTPLRRHGDTAAETADLFEGILRARRGPAAANAPVCVP
jgi:glycosyltransferase involved in cell wall biosynthesis